LAFSIWRARRTSHGSTGPRNGCGAQVARGMRDGLLEQQFGFADGDA
jgi:hypothetical protein